MKLLINPKVKKKMKDKYDISPKDIKECFLNREKGFLIDTEHKYGYSVFGFIAKTNRGRSLKIIFVEHEESYELKAAHPADQTEERTYECKA